MTGWLFGLGILAGLLKLVLLALLAAALYGALTSWRRSSSFRPSSYLTYRKRSYRSMWFKLLLMPGTDHERYQEKQRLLLSCGWRIEAGTYMLLQRSAAIVGCMLLLAALAQGKYAPGLLSSSERLLLLLLSAGLAIAAAADKPILERLGQIRRYRVIRDIDALSRQLLYYSGLPGNIHGKLLRCLPFAGSLRPEWYQLTSEWYHSAEAALRRFAQRVATDEGRSFADTISALRHYDSDRYYELLRARIADYKVKLELFKESRKESMSYVLFVISGIPILYTFRVFIYPWVAEGQKLFESLN